MNSSLVYGLMCGIVLLPRTVSADPNTALANDQTRHLQTSTAFLNLAGDAIKNGASTEVVCGLYTMADRYHTEALADNEISRSDTNLAPTLRADMMAGSADLVATRVALRNIMAQRNCPRGD